MPHLIRRAKLSVLMVDGIHEPPGLEALLYAMDKVGYQFAGNHVENTNI